MFRLRVGGVTPLTTIDYPGELAAVLFCQGCPWRCRYCHNAHLLDAGGGDLLEWEGIVDFLHRRRGLLDAVVFSGGEPTAQQGLAQAMRTARELGFKVGLHSAGCHPQRLAGVLPLVNWIGLDIKTLPEDYPALTGVPDSGRRAFDSLRLVLEAGVAYEVRITVHPTLLPPQRLERLLTLLHATGAQNIVLQRCQPGHGLDVTLNDAPAYLPADRCTPQQWHTVQPPS